MGTRSDIHDPAALAAACDDLDGAGERITALGTRSQAHLDAVTAAVSGLQVDGAPAPAVPDVSGVVTAGATSVAAELSRSTAALRWWLHGVTGADTTGASGVAKS